MNAVLGAVVIGLFGNYVLEGMNSFTLSDVEKTSIMEEAVKLGEASAPGSLTVDLQNKVDAIYQASFIRVYKWVGLLSAGLAFLSAGIAFFMVEGRKN